MENEGIEASGLKGSLIGLATGKSEPLFQSPDEAPAALEELKRLFFKSTGHRGFFCEFIEIRFVDTDQMRVRANFGQQKLEVDVPRPEDKSQKEELRAHWLAFFLPCLERMKTAGLTDVYRLFTPDAKAALVKMHQRSEETTAP